MEFGSPIRTPHPKRQSSDPTLRWFPPHKQSVTSRNSRWISQILGIATSSDMCFLWVKLPVVMGKTTCGWWFQIFWIIFLLKIWGHDPIWRLHIFKWVGSTTNYIVIHFIGMYFTNANRDALVILIFVLLFRWCLTRYVALYYIAVYSATLFTCPLHFVFLLLSFRFLLQLLYPFALDYVALHYICVILHSNVFHDITSSCMALCSMIRPPACCLISHHIWPYDMINVIQCNILSYHIIPYHIISYHIPSYHINTLHIQQDIIFTISIYIYIIHILCIYHTYIYHTYILHIYIYSTYILHTYILHILYIYMYIDIYMLHVKCHM